MPRRPVPVDGLDKTIRRFDDHSSRLDTLERPDGNQLNRSLAKVQQLLTDLPGLITSALSAGFTAASATITGALSAASATVTGALGVGGNLSASGTVKMPSVYNTQITSTFRVVYNGNGDGSMGYNLSSRRFKQDISGYTIDPDLLRQLRIVTFRYIAAVEKLGDDASTEVGLIAEEVEDLGLNWLVDYDSDGQPEGLKFDRLAVAALALAQDVDARLTNIEKMLT